MSHMGPPRKVQYKPTKAQLTAVGTFVAACIAFFVADTGGFTVQDAGQMILTAGGAAGLLGFGVYKVQNKPKPPQ